MDLSNKTLHKLQQRRQFIETTNSKLQEAENKYLHYQNKKEHLYDEKKPNVIKRAYQKTTKPYELQYHITRSVDDKGNETYKQGFKIAESSGNNYHQRGMLHKVDSFRRNNVHSDVSGLKTIPHIVSHSYPGRAVHSAARYAANTSVGSTVVGAVKRANNTKAGQAVTKKLRHTGSAAYTAASFGAEGAFRTGLAAETGLLHIKDNVQYRTKAALDSKVRQEAQGDADKAGVMLIANTAAASKGLIQHINDKRHYKPLEKSLNKQMRTSSKLAKAESKFVKKQNRQFIKSAIIAERFQQKTGRAKTASDNLQYVLNKKQKLRLLAKKDKDFKNDLAIEKLNGKLTKLRNRKDKAKKKLYKLKTRPLSSKAAAALAYNFRSSLRNKAMRDGAADNDAVMAVDKISTLGRKQLKKRNSKEVKLNKRLKKYSRREESYHKKTAKKKKKAPNHSKSNLNAQRVYKEYAAKKAKRAARRKKGSKFGLAVIGLISPIILMPLLLTACLGIFANPGSFNFITGYYGASEGDLTNASDYYQELAYDLNKFVLSVPDEWEDNLTELNIPSNYTDDPTRFVFGNSDRLHSDITYDYDKHKLYSYLCAFLLTKDDEGAVKNWDFNTEAKEVVEDLFKSEYEFRSFYDNTSHWEYRNQFEYYGYYLYDGCFWDGEHGFVNVTYPDALPEPVQVALEDHTLYFNVTNGEILDYNNEYAATGWYLQNHYYNTIDNSGHTYNGWYDGEECHYGIHRDDGSFIPFSYVIHDENWISILHKYDRINECTLYYTVDRKKSFDDCIKDSLLSLEGGESLYEYYLTLSPDTEPQYYGMHQTGTSPVYYGYVDLLEKGYILHGFGYEMKKWNEADCDFNTNDKEHSGISIIQNSGSNVYAMVGGEITEVGDNYFILRGFEKDRKIYIEPVIVYVNVDTSALSEGQEFEKGEVITHTNNRRQEMKYLKQIPPGYFDHGFVSLVDNSTGYDYLNITIFDFMDYRKTVIDPEIILSLANKN